MSVVLKLTVVSLPLLAFPKLLLNIDLKLQSWVYSTGLITVCFIDKHLLQLLRTCCFEVGNYTLITLRPKDVFGTTKEDDVVYRIPCKCGKVVIGETGRLMQGSIKERRPKYLTCPYPDLRRFRSGHKKTEHHSLWNEVKGIDCDTQ